jgi:NAD(P)-dependent dehydrogenase (short-subunit alcohol dehydrogenase family)
VLRAVVTGANRGIGLELVHQLLQRGAEVEAGVRQPGLATDLEALGRQYPALRVRGCDVGDDASVRAFASGGDDAAVDLLVNNAGVSGKWQSVEDLDYDDMLRTYSLNALGPLRVTRAFLPRLRRSAGAKAVHVSSDMGSLARNVDGGAHGYRMSKAALNMASRTLAVDLRADRIVSVAVNPGWVQTAMGGPGAPVPVDVSVRGMLEVIDRLTPEDSGGFFDFTGAPIPW